jgi:ketosteroid isomerase-like protein
VDRIVSTESDICTLITRWVEAIVSTDLDGVVAHHSDDIVMLDVPPPYEGIRGMDAYRASWPPFFDFIRSGATFELLELNVEAGEDVAFAHGLRCGGEKEPGVTRTTGCA